MPPDSHTEMDLLYSNSAIKEAFNSNFLTFTSQQEYCHCNSEGCNLQRVLRFGIYFGGGKL